MGLQIHCRAGKFVGGTGGSQGRETCFFSAVDSSIEPDVDPSYDIGMPRMVPYRIKWRRPHDAVYWFDLKSALDKGRVFWQTMSNANRMLKVVHADQIGRMIH